MKYIKIDILRAEYHRIVPPEYHPDLEMQANHNIHVLSYLLHAESLMIVKDLGIIGPANDTNNECVKAISAHHVLLTDTLLQAIPKLPNPQKDIACGFGDISEFRDNLEGFMHQTYSSLKPNLTPKGVDEIWESIKAAYGSEYAPPDAAIFENMSLYVAKADVGKALQRFMPIAVHRHPTIVEKLQQRLPYRKEQIFILKQ